MSAQEIAYGLAALGVLIFVVAVLLDDRRPRT